MNASNSIMLMHSRISPVAALSGPKGRDLSTLAPLRALRARTPVPAWARRAVGEGVKSWPRGGKRLNGRIPILIVCFAISYHDPHAAWSFADGAFLPGPC